MQKQNNSPKRLPVCNHTGKHKIEVAHVASVEKIKGETIVTDKNKDQHTCKWSLKNIERKFPDSSLIIIKRNVMVNLNQIEEDEKISFDKVKLKGGAMHCICYRLSRELKRMAKEYKLEFWKDYRKII